MERIRCSEPNLTFEASKSDFLYLAHDFFWCSGRGWISWKSLGIRKKYPTFLFPNLCTLLSDPNLTLITLFEDISIQIFGVRSITRSSKVRFFLISHKSNQKFLASMRWYADHNESFFSENVICSMFLFRINNWIFLELGQ